MVRSILLATFVLAFIAPLYAQAPPLAVAPFDAATAKKHQQDWASYLKVQPVTTNSVNMKLALIPPGEFLMGSPPGEADRRESETQHRVRITKPFYLGQTEVTIGQFREFATAESYKTRDGKGGWGYDEQTNKFVGGQRKYTWKYTGYTMTDDHPVVNVSWNDAQAYCAWLTKKEGKSYHLPTEAEWEYACRAGTTTAYFHGNDREELVKVGNVADGDFRTIKPGGSTYDWSITARDGYVFSAPVAQFRANGFGLYDMHGNVWEWCGDWYGAKYYEMLAGRTTDDPQGDATEQRSRVIRGGCWLVDYPRSADRGNSSPDDRVFNYGFRCVRTP